MHKINLTLLVTSYGMTTRIRSSMCITGHLAIVEHYEGHTTSLDRQTSDCLIDADQTTPLLQEHSDEDDALLNIQPTVSDDDLH